MILSESSDPLREITFPRNSLIAREHHPRRIGRPKARWADTERKNLWERIQNIAVTVDEYDDKVALLREQILELARHRYTKKKARTP